MDQKNDQVEFEVVSGIRIFGKSRAVGVRFFAEPDAVAEHVGVELKRVESLADGQGAQPADGAGSPGPQGDDTTMESSNAASEGQDNAEAKAARLASFVAAIGALADMHRTTADSVQASPVPADSASPTTADTAAAELPVTATSALTPALDKHAAKPATTKAKGK